MIMPQYGGLLQEFIMIRKAAVHTNPHSYDSKQSLSANPMIITMALTAATGSMCMAHRPTPAMISYHGITTADLHGTQAKTRQNST